MATAELLCELHLLEAHDAGGVHANSVLWLGQVDVGQLLQLVDEGPRFEEKLNGVVQLREGVQEVRQDVERELAVGDDPDEQASVQQQHEGVEQYAAEVEHESLLDPLLPEVEFDEVELVLEAGPHAFEQHADELEADDHVELAHLGLPLLRLLLVEELLVEEVGDAGEHADQEVQEQHDARMLSPVARLAADQEVAALVHQPEQRPEQEHRHHRYNLVNVERVPEHDHDQDHVEKLVTSLLSQVLGLDDLDVSEENVDRQVDQPHQHHHQAVE
mmetsp:Transcript_14608/g.22646  ORF Transcript_14608/g.22646 Transcript_14608/m.22646 type:complete len:274 (+) Transcript_14608:654-1475(+)